MPEWTGTGDLEEADQEGWGLEEEVGVMVVQGMSLVTHSTHPLLSGLRLQEAFGEIHQNQGYGISTLTKQWAQIIHEGVLTMEEGEVVTLHEVDLTGAVHMEAVEVAIHLP